MTPEQAQALDDEACAAQLTTPEGRRFARRLIFRHCDYMGQTVGHHSGINSDQRAGQRDVAIAVVNDLQRVNPSAFSILVAEQDQEIASVAIAARRAAISVGNGHTADG